MSKVLPDELLLAIALQEINARGLAPGMGEFFVNSTGDAVRFDDPTLRCCCAAGALVLGGVCKIVGDHGKVVGLPRDFDGFAISEGNDDSNHSWSKDSRDRGATMGHAFQLALDAYGPSPSDLRRMARKAA